MANIIQDTITKLFNFGNLPDAVKKKGKDKYSLPADLPIYQNDSLLSPSINDQRFLSQLSGVLRGNGGKISDAVKQDNIKSPSYLVNCDRESARHTYFLMSVQPIIFACLRLHLQNLFSMPENEKHALSIEPADLDISKEDGKLVDELQIKFQDFLDENIYNIVINTAIYGYEFLELFFENPENSKGGVADLSWGNIDPAKIYGYSDYFGNLIGWSIDAPASNINDIHLSAENILHFKMPIAIRNHTSNYPLNNYYNRRRNEPNYNLQSMEDPRLALYEINNYGTSCLFAAYEPYQVFQIGYKYLLQNRKASSVTEYFINAHVGTLDHINSNRFLDKLGEGFQRNDRLIQEEMSRYGGAKMIRKYNMVPTSGENGNVGVFAFNPETNINGIEDIKFTVAHLCASLGVDPGIIGFGETLSGGLGEGGYNRLSAIAGGISRQLQTVAHTFNKVLKYHVYSKYGKLYNDDYCPWMLRFPAISNAYEVERMANLQSKIGVGIELVSLIQTVLGENIDADEMNNILSKYVIGSMIPVEELQKIHKKVSPAEGGVEQPAASPDSPDLEGF